MMLQPESAIWVSTRSASAPFRHVFLKRRLDLVAEGSFHILAADIVLIGPAAVADGADIDEAGLDLVHLGVGRAAEGEGDAERR